jgi:hypothetical protein
MRPTVVWADQYVFPQAQIVLDVGEAATLNPSPVGRDWLDAPATFFPPPVEDDGYFPAFTELVLQGLPQF